MPQITDPLFFIKNAFKVITRLHQAWYKYIVNTYTHLTVSIIVNMSICLESSVTTDQLVPDNLRFSFCGPTDSNPNVLNYS